MKVITSSANLRSTRMAWSVQRVRKEHWFKVYKKHPQIVFKAGFTFIRSYSLDTFDVNAPKFHNKFR